MTLQTESSLDCPICTNRFTIDGLLQPKILKCGHTFCTKCISEIVKSQSGMNVIQCSFCYGATPMGALGIYALPVNRTLVDLLFNVNLKEPVTPLVDLCCYCKEHPAEKICFGCDPTGCKLCEQCCKDEHTRPFDPVKLHKPLNIDEVTSIPKNHCSTHKQKLTHYSEKTATFACKKCLAEKKDDIDVEFLSIDEAVEPLKQNLPKVMKELESYLKRLQDAQHGMEEVHTQLGESKAKAMQDILKKFTKFQAIFQERQKILLTNLETEVSDVNVCLV